MPINKETGQNAAADSHVGILYSRETQVHLHPMKWVTLTSWME